MSGLFFKNTGSTLAYHRMHPDVTPYQHILSKSREMADYVNGRKIIYLDTKFWLKLRDAAMGYPQEAIDVQLLSAAISAISAGHAIFPVAADMVMELMNVGDDVRRRTCADIVDKLSQGITLRPESERVEMEVEDFLLRKGLEKSVDRIRDQMWTCAGFAFGLTVPQFEEVDAALSVAMQKSFVDHLYTIGYATQNEMLGRPPPIRDSESLAQQLNHLNRKHAGDANSFPKLLDHEFRGALDAYMPAIASALTGVTSRHLSRPPTAADIRGAEAEAPKLASILALLSEDGRIADFVPSLVIRASLAAAVRWDKARQYRENDFHDFSHAVAALPYFEVFATEKSLAHLTANDLKLGGRYGCRVVKTSPELLAEIPSG